MKTYLIALLLVTLAAPAFGAARIKPPATNNSMSSQFAYWKCEYLAKYGWAIPAPDLKLERRGGLTNPNTIIFGVAY
jgi:hypothetical protein